MLKEQFEALQIALREMLKSNYLIKAIIMILIENFYQSDLKKKEVEAEIRDYVNQNLQNLDFCGKDFQQMFHYQGKTIQEGFWKKMSERDKQYFAKKVNTVTEQVNQHLKAKLDADRLNQIGEKQDYSRTFFINLSKMKNKLLRGERMNDPCFFVAKGRDLQAQDLQPKNAMVKAPPLAKNTGFSQAKEGKGLSNQIQQKPIASTLSKQGKAVQQMSNAMLVNQSFFFSRNMKS